MTVLLSLFMLLIMHNYIVYPIMVMLLAKFKPLPHTSNSNYRPSVSILIAAYNEENVIRRKLENTLALNYPPSSLQIIVVADGSTDRTPQIVEEFSHQGVMSLHIAERGGKSAAINRAVQHASGEILVFSDANNDYSKDAIAHLVSHFSDSSVGGVTGSKRIYTNLDRESAKGDGLYWQYESAIKMAESKIGSITAAEGEIFAVRKTVFKPIPRGVINDDAAITFNIIKSGYRVLYDKQAEAYEQASISLVDDFYVKVRMATGGYQTLMLELGYLFSRPTWFAFSFVSHKVLRWLSPHFLIFVFILTIALASSLLMKAFLALQIAFYVVAMYGWLNRNTRDMPSLIYIPMYFCSMNLAMFIGFIRFIFKSQSVNWRKAAR